MLQIFNQLYSAAKFLSYFSYYNLNATNSINNKLFSKQLFTSFKFCSQSTIQEEMINAAKLNIYALNGNIEKLKELHESHISLDSQDYDQRTPLHVAAATGNLPVVKWLIENGAIMKQDRFGGYFQYCLPVHDAIRHKHFDVRDYLLQQQQQLKIKIPILQNERKNQLQQVFELIIKEGLFNYSLVDSEINYFYTTLGIDDHYFNKFTPSEIKKHIHFLISAKNVAELTFDRENIMNKFIEKQDEAFFLCSEQNQQIIENEITNYLAKIPINKQISLIRITSKGPIIQGGQQRLLMYIVKVSDYENPQEFNSYNIYQISGKDFLQRKSAGALNRYKEILNELSKSPRPVLKIFELENKQKVIVIAANQGRDKQQLKQTSQYEITHKTLLPELSRVFKNQKIKITKKNIESFSNGVVIYSSFLEPGSELSENVIKQIQNVSNLIFVIPNNPLIQWYISGKISGRQLLFYYSAAVFTYYFTTQYNDDINWLQNNLTQQPEALKKIMNLKQNFLTEAIKEEKIFEIIQKNEKLAMDIFIEFSKTIKGSWPNYVYPNIDKLVDDITDQATKQVFKSFILFIRSIARTNFFSTSHCALCYRLNPKIFISKDEYPAIPYGIYMLIGQNFQGFHVRFKDISRGGIRLIKSQNGNFQTNKALQFKENYKLAYTQMLKNKDIPESGSKGTILMREHKDYMTDQAFIQYIDSILSLQLVENGIIDLTNGKEEILFLGPDENTANYMDYASTFAHQKGYKYWNSYTTGKSTHRGGIPHDEYGMTTRSVRQYVKGIIKHLNLNESKCTKIMTGGPDGFIKICYNYYDFIGDLGSNEIKMSNEIIKAIIDGSGVLYDPEGINRADLIPLTQQRIGIANYNGKISKNGYLVKCKDKDVTLPDGTYVMNGYAFRDKFIFLKEANADFFVPCGGRPEVVTTQNVHLFLKENSKQPKFKYIVEGANLYFTEQARLFLEDHGVILFKDSSANKGGVTSSSFEVLAAMCLEEKEFATLMHKKKGYENTFYDQYVQAVIKKIEENAEVEFEYMWKKHKESGIHFTQISNMISEQINNLQNQLLQNKDGLFDNINIRKNILTNAIPSILVNQVGIDKIINRLPESYQHSLFSNYIATQYYFKYGGDMNDPFLFYKFMRDNIHASSF